MKKIYIAASLDAKLFAQVIARCLDRENLAIDFVSSWTEARTGYDRPSFDLQVDAEKDYEDVKSADILLHLCPHIRSSKGGADTELGIAIGLGKEVIVFGERLNMFHNLKRVTVISSYLDLTIHLGHVAGKQVAI